MIMTESNPHFFGLDKSFFFFGKVESRDDPLQLGRVQVRIFGLHPDDTNLVATHDLPWAFPIMPINSAMTSGVGHAPVGVLPGSIVVGFFADGIDRQIPMFFGTMSGGTGHFGAGGDGATGQPDMTSVPPPANIPVSGSVVQKGTAASKILLSRFGSSMKPHMAAAITGNLAHESGLRAIREGSSNDTTPWPRGTSRKGYGWAQWTDTAPNKGNYTLFLNYCDQYKLDPSSYQAQSGFLAQWLAQDRQMQSYMKNLTSGNKITVNEKFRGNPYCWNGTYDCATVEGATAYWMAVAERPAKSGGRDHLDARVSYAKQILNGLQSGSNGTGGPIVAQQKPQTGTKAPPK